MEKREEFGHWGTDLVIGNKSGRDNVLLTLIERKTRELFVVRLPDKSADSVISVFERVKKELEDKFGKVFRTITTDNGSEFARLPEPENASEVKIYFAHPYTSCEKGTIENHNGLIRRLIRAGLEFFFKILCYREQSLFRIAVICHHRSLFGGQGDAFILIFKEQGSCF